MGLRALSVFLFVFLFAFYSIRSAATLDPDFGWHLQFGRLIGTTGKIPLTDPYSYTMPSYHFVDHEWGMDIIIAKVYDSFGMWPLTIGAALIGITTLIIIGRGTNLRWGAIVLFLVGGTLIEFVGVRPQIISWLFLAVLTSLLFQKNLWQRYRFFLPLLFLLWANLHGGFAIGIVVLGIFVFGQMAESRTFDSKDFAVFIFSFLATLCNPYGYHLWTEVLKSATDPVLRNSVQEWFPAIYSANLAFWIYAALSVFLLVRYHKRFSNTQCVLYCVLFISGMTSIRNIAIFVIVSFYPTIKGIEYLYEEAGRHQFGKERFKKGYSVFFIICLLFFLPQLGLFTYEIVVFQAGLASYPMGAVRYLRSHMPKGQIFSTYGWGGYLLWQLPEKKVFIDGRMPSWRNTLASANESTYAYGEFLHILEKKESFATTVNRYGIDTLLVTKSDLYEKPFHFFGIPVETHPLLKFLFGSPLTFSKVVSQVRHMGWKEVYHDKTSVVFEKQ